MVALLIAYILNVIDYLLTAYWVNLYGAEIEANPLMRWAFERDIAWLIKIFAVGGLFTLLWCFVEQYDKYKWSGYFLAVVYGLTLIYHSFLFFMF
jgi:hypothetical protein